MIPQRAKVFLTAAEKDLVVKLYIEDQRPAWEVARALERRLWSQHDIYRIARQEERKRGIEFVTRNTNENKIDWQLVHQLRLENMTWADIAEFIGSGAASIKGLYHHRRRAGRFDGG